MEGRYKLLFLLISGLKKWEENKETVPEKVHQGQRLFIRECAKSGVEPPIDLPNFVRLLERPSGEWGITNLQNLFPPDASLLDKEIGVTIEAEDFLEDFQSPDEYEQSVMKRILLYCRDLTLDSKYREIRTFLSNPKHAVIPFHKIYELKSKLNDVELAQLFHACYKEIENVDQYRQCPHCGWTLEWKNGHWRCNKESICHSLGDFKDLDYFPKTDQKLFRLIPGIHKYILLPGMSEIRLAEKLRKKGLMVTLYPNVDQYDIQAEANDKRIFMDVKDYRSPFQLAQYINRNLHKLEDEIWYVVPDYRVKLFPGYLDTVKSQLQNNETKLFNIVSEKQAIKEAEWRLK
ncbi:hypothetical protein [Neobacillus citreus]|uniref:REase associating with pPIWI RE domain-containing protein n=1 Tax=Neobacillus citreus TaxID=2833578 RepID=A0A942YBX0_9BACI|nr:hypothetical protein [Neobacillus citreus]MCH6265337.1 hypothetical protein [Neobacillus citreus]